MNVRILTTLLGIAILAVPAAVPASQPADVRLGDLAQSVTAAPATPHLAMLLADPERTGDLAIMLPHGHTTLAWIDQDPFAR